MHKITELRLKAEFELLESLQEKSKYISVEFFGNPITRYIVTYTCTGIYSVSQTGEIQRSTFHQMEVVLPDNYPLVQPRFKWLTPIFHPNIVPNLDVCIGDVWNISKTISEFLVDIGEMIQYKRYNPDNSYNPQAASWAIQNKHILPIGREILLEPEKLNVDTGKQEGHSVVINNPQNVNLNIATTLSDVRQNIKSIQTFNQSEKDGFEKLISQLMQELQKAPADKAQDAEAVAEYAKELVDEASKEKPKKIKISISKEGLIKAAENIASVLPMVLQIAKQVVNHTVVAG